MPKKSVEKNRKNEKRTKTVNTKLSETQKSPQLKKEMADQPVKESSTSLLQKTAKKKLNMDAAISKSHNPFHRMRTPEKSAHALLIPDGDHFIVKQFLTNSKDPLNRPLQEMGNILKPETPSTPLRVYDFSQVQSKPSASPISKTAERLATETKLELENASKPEEIPTPRIYDLSQLPRKSDAFGTSSSSVVEGFTSGLDSASDSDPESESTSTSSAMDTSPESSDTDAPPFTPSKRSKVRSAFSPSVLEGISFFTRGGTEMHAKRHVKMRMEDGEKKEEGEVKKTQELFKNAMLLMLSPRKKRRHRDETDNESFSHSVTPGLDENINDERPLKRSRTTGPESKIESESKAKLESKAESENTPPITPLFTRTKSRKTKGGKQIRVKLKSHIRYPLQNAVMDNTSAKKYLLDYIDKKYDKYKTEEEQKILEHLKRLANDAPMEWLHCLAISLAPPSFQPQTKDNLGAAPNWINTYMMVLESLAEYFVKKYPKSVEVTPIFTMLEDSDLIHTIDYKVTIKGKNRKLIVESKTLNALDLQRSRHNWPSSTDSLHVKRVSAALLEGQEPNMESRFKFH